MEEDDDDAGAADIELRRNVQQHPAVAVGLVLPINMPAGRSMAAASPLDDVEKRLAAGHFALIRERRSVEIDQRRLCLRQWRDARADRFPPGQRLERGIANRRPAV